MPTNESLKLKQKYPLELKIELTKARIREWVDFYGKNNVYISFSGGKDSTVLLDIVRSIYPDIEAVFVNTGLEYPEIVQFVKTFNNVTILRPKENFKQVIEKYGYPIISKEVSETIDGARKNILDNKKYLYRMQKLNLDKDNRYNQSKWKFLLDVPFKISNKCCDVMKKRPIKEYIKNSGKFGILGMIAEESLLRKQLYIKNSCNGFNSKNPTSNPLMFWTEQDILKYIYKNNLKIAKVYGNVIQKDLFGNQYELSGVKRTGCMFCMFGVHLEKSPNRFEIMKNSHPTLYNYCMNRLGLKNVLDFIKVKY